MNLHRLPCIPGREALELEWLRASEAEQQRIAADLHDTLCPDLTALGCAAKALQRRLEKEGNPLAAAAEAIVSAASEAVARTRRIVHGLEPGAAGGESLAGALQALAAEAGRMSRTPCDFHCGTGVAATEDAVAHHLYRIAQEALRNAVRHSGATRIEVELRESRNAVRLVVRDNGCGLSNGAARGPGFGLRGMRTRAGLIHGRLTIRKRKTGGTEVICRVPAPGAGHENGRWNPSSRQGEP